MTLDEILRKYMAKTRPETELDDSFKLYVDQDSDIVYMSEGGTSVDYAYTGENGELPSVLDFILNEAGIK